MLNGDIEVILKFYRIRFDYQANPGFPKFYIELGQTVRTLVAKVGNESQR